MKKAILLDVLTTAAFAAQRHLEAPPFTVTVSGPRRVVLGADVAIEIKVLNTSEKPLSFVFRRHFGWQMDTNRTYETRKVRLCRDWRIGLRNSPMERSCELRVVRPETP